MPDPTPKPEEGDLRVWWTPQLGMPGEPFFVSVASVDEALLIHETLAYYDLYQFDNKIKTDYSNTGGLELYRSGEWEEWEDADCNNIGDLRRDA